MLAQKEKPAVERSLRISDLDCALLRNLVLQQQLAREQLNVLVLQFLQTSEARALQGNIEALASKLNLKSAELFNQVGLDPTEFQLNVDTGEFLPRLKPKMGAKDAANE